MTTIVTGYYGSGKTEFVVNLAMTLAEETGQRITIADLDIINPFFRSRERAKDLAALGIDVMGSAIENHVAQDIPAVSYGFLSRVRAGERVILDLAGGEAGLHLLAGCQDAIGIHEFLCVLNAYRPETDTAVKMVAFCKVINAKSPFPLTGLINNGHMLSHTSGEVVLASQEMVLEAAGALGLPLKYTLVQEDVYRGIEAEVISEKVLPFVKPQMREDWQG